MPISAPVNAACSMAKLLSSARQLENDSAATAPSKISKLAGLSRQERGEAVESDADVTVAGP